MTDIYICDECGKEFSKKYSLNDYRTVVGTHLAFNKKSKLEVLAEKYGVEITFCPKFHCEINPIEGL